MKRHRPIRGLRAGLTLIDTVVVLTIMAIIGAVALPRYSLALATYRVSAAANRLAADLALAQNVAKITSAGQTITFSITDTSYRFSSYVNPVSTTSGVYFVSLTGDPYRAAFSSVNFNNTTQLTYDRFGQPISGGTVVVQVGTALKTITVDANTGKASVQ